MVPIYVSEPFLGSAGSNCAYTPTNWNSNCACSCETFVIPFPDVVNIEVRFPLVVGDLFRGRSLLSVLALKLTSRISTGTSLSTDAHGYRLVRFAENPAAFVEACRSAMSTRR